MSTIALDYGEKRVGVAISFEGFFARRYLTIEYQTEEELLSKISEICEKEDVEEIIVGLPKTLRNEIGPQAEKIQEFTKRLKEAIKRPVILVDEALTTEEAKENLKKQGLSLRDANNKLDEEAAKLVLQDFLNSNHKS